MSRKWEYIVGNEESNSYVLQSDDGRFLLMGTYDSRSQFGVKRSFKVANLEQGRELKEYYEKNQEG